MIRVRNTNRREIERYLATFSRRIEAALIYQLEAYVAELQNHAKEAAEYNDITANLKSSIGGVVLKNGKPITYKGFEGNGGGGKKGIEYIKSIMVLYPKGYVIIISAGMEYATYVEDIYQLNVLKKTELKMSRELPGILEKLKRKIEALP